MIDCRRCSINNSYDNESPLLIQFIATCNHSNFSGPGFEANWPFVVPRRILANADDSIVFPCRPPPLRRTISRQFASFVYFSASSSSSSSFWPCPALVTRPSFPPRDLFGNRVEPRFATMFINDDLFHPRLLEGLSTNLASCFTFFSPLVYPAI